MKYRSQIASKLYSFFSISAFSSLWKTAIALSIIVSSLGLLLNTFLSLKEIHKWEARATLDMIKAAQASISMSIEFLDARQAETVIDGLMATGSFTFISIIDDFDSELASRSIDAPDNLYFESVMDAIGLNTRYTINEPIPLPTGQMGSVILDVNSQKFIAPMLFRVGLSAGLVSLTLVLVALAVYLSGSKRLLSGFRVLQIWVMQRSRGEVINFPAKSELKFIELYEFGELVNRVIDDLFNKQHQLEQSLEALNTQTATKERQASILEQILVSSNQVVFYFESTKTVRIFNQTEKGISLVQKIPKEPIFNSASMYEQLQKNMGETHLFKKLSNQQISTPSNSGILYVIEFEGWHGNMGTITAIDLGDQNLALLITDVTDERNMARTIQQSQKMESLGALTSGVAHDFNNLLSIIIGNLELIQLQAKKIDSIESCVNAALSASERGASVVKALLTFSRQNELHSKEYSISNIINDVMPILRGSLDSKYSLNKSQDHEYTLLVNREVLETSLLNLVINARDAMPNGGSISLRIREATNHDLYSSGLKPEYDYVVVEVCDTGTGIKGSIRDRIIDPFFTTKPVGKGTGLGLSMIYSFANQSGGKLNYKNNENIGATFSIVLPILQCIPTNNFILKDNNTIQKLKNKVTKAQGQVLIIEDEISLLEVLSTACTASGFAVHTAKNTKKAKKIINSLGSDLQVIVSDMHLTDGTGIDILNFIKKNNHHVKFILMSGNVDSKGFADDLYLDDYIFNILPKPFQLTSFISTVKSALQSHKNKNEPANIA